MTGTSSQQVSWWSVHEWVQSRLDKVDSWPLLGTPEWCELDDSDRRKWAALLDAAQHHALRIEAAQEAQCEASREISDAEDWSSVANEIRNRNDVFAQRPWLKRVAS